MVTRNVPGRDPQLVIGRLPPTLALGADGRPAFAAQSREPALRSHENVDVRANVEKPSDSDQLASARNGYR
jgi:hypothetical protein